MSPPHAAFGPSLRTLRTARGLSQQGLAEIAEVSTRHLSYLETGRSAPSRTMVLVLGSALDLPLRDRNALLRVAGFAPVYPGRRPAMPLDPSLQGIVDHLLRAHEPFGAILLDRDWNVLQLNEGARRLMSWLWEGRTPAPDVQHNLVRTLLDPDGIRDRVSNWADAANALADRVRRELGRELDPERRRFLGHLVAHLDLPPAEPSAQLPVLPLRLARGETHLSLVTALTTLGTPLDVTADELHIESFFPADAASETLLRAWAAP